MSWTYPSLASTRLDLKCGRGAISQGEKCHKGAATTVQKDETVKKVAIGAAVGVGALAGAMIAKHRWTPKASQRLRDAKTSGPQFTPADIPPQAKFLAKGAYGKVYVSSDRKSIFKVIQDHRGMRMFGREVAGHMNAQGLGVRTPKIKAVDMQKGLVEMEFLDGYETLDKLYTSTNIKQRQAVRDSLITEMSKLHRAGWGHGDFHKGNIMFKDGDAAVLDWSFAEKNMVRVKEDIWRVIGIARKLSPLDQEAKVYELGERFMNLRQHTDSDVNTFYEELAKRLGIQASPTAVL